MSLLRPFRDRRGGATVEYVFWIPFFVGLLALIVDVSLLLNMRARMLDAATSAARQVSLRYMDDAEAKTWAEALFADGVATVDVAKSEDERYVTAEVRVPYSKAMLFGGDLLERGFFDSENLYIRMKMPVALEEDPGGGEVTGAILTGR